MAVAGVLYLVFFALYLCDSYEGTGGVFRFLFPISFFDVQRYVSPREEIANLDMYA